MLCRAVCGGLRGGLRAVAGRRIPVPAAALQVRHMSSGIPTSGSNLAFMVLGGGSLTAALFYAYKTVHSDSVRYSDRIAEIETRLKSQEEVPADDPASTAEVTTLHAVAEAVEAVELATEALSEGFDTGPTVMVDTAVAEEPVAETVIAIAMDTPPDVKEAAEDLVSVAVEAAEATGEPTAVEEAPAA